MRNKTRAIEVVAPCSAKDGVTAAEKLDAKVAASHGMTLYDPKLHGLQSVIASSVVTLEFRDGLLQLLRLLFLFEKRARRKVVEFH